MHQLFLKKTGLYVLRVGTCIVCVWIGFRPYCWVVGSTVKYDIPRYIQYGFTVQNETDHVIDRAELWVYAPVKQTATQQCIHLDASFPFQVIADDMGNQVLRFTFRNVPSYATKIVRVKANLLLSENARPVSDKNIRAFLQPGKYCESDDRNIMELAKKLEKGNRHSTAENIFQWVSRNIAYAGYVKNVRGALSAMKNKEGDCTEFMYLFMALCRAGAVPARGIGGYLCDTNTVLRPGEYHNWAEFYDGGTWHLADPQQRVFDRGNARYIAMRILSGKSKDIMGECRRFRCVGEGITVTMNVN